MRGGSCAFVQAQNSCSDKTLRPETTQIPAIFHYPVSASGRTTYVEGKEFSMYCREYDELFGEYALGEEGALSPAEREHAEAHLRESASCREALQDHKTAGQQFSDIEIALDLQATGYVRHPSHPGQSTDNPIWKEGMARANSSRTCEAVTTVLSRSISSGVPYDEIPARRTSSTSAVDADACSPYPTMNRLWSSMNATR